MKQVAIWLVIFCLVASFAGCGSAPLATGTPAPAGTVAPSATVNPSSAAETLAATPSVFSPSPLPSASASPEPSATPTATPPSPTQNVSAEETYISASLGLSFAVPLSWKGKYRVEEGDGILSVYFSPSKPLKKNSWSGELFSIVQKKTDGSQQSVNGDWTFELGGRQYVWGIADSMAYSASAPQFDTYCEMQNDFDTVFQTVQSDSGQTPANVKRIWIETVPKKTGYATTMGLGIQFTLPDRWLGKCRIVERADYVSFFFKPQKPMDTSLGDGFFFSISRKTSDEDTEFMDNVREFEINGVTYISGTSTDVSYSQGQPEYDTYLAMCGDRQEILDSVRAIQ